MRTIQFAKDFCDYEHSTTLQINLLFGTVMLPKAHWYKTLGDFIIDHEKIPNTTITYKQKEVTALILLHCLRNGISHWKENQNSNIEFIHSNNEIVKVKISGSGKVNNKFERIDVLFDVENNGIIEFMSYISTLLE